MLCPRLVGVLRRVELVEGHQSRPASDARALHHFLGHGSNRHVLDLHIARFDLACRDLGNEMIRVVIGHEP